MSSLLGNNGWTSFGNGTPELFVKLLLMDFYASSIYLQDRDTPDFDEFEEDPKFSPALQTALGIWTEPAENPDEYVALVREHEEVLSDVQDLLTSINFLIRILQYDRETGSFSTSQDRDYQQRIIIFQELCSARLSNLVHYIERLN